MKTRRLAALAAGLMLFALLPACGSSAKKTTTGSPQTSTASDIDPAGIVRIIDPAPPSTTWDPAHAVQPAQDIQYFLNVYDTLLYLDGDGKLQPDLATSWKFDATNTVLTLTLRDDVTFTDGAKFDATVAKTNLDRVHASTGLTANLLNGVQSVAAPSPTQLVITMKAANAKNLYALATTASSMVSPLALQDPAALARHPVGSGPFLLQSVNATTATFVRNDKYWNKSVKLAAGLVITGATDGTARINAMLSGAADFGHISQTPPTPDLSAQIKAGKFKSVTIPATPSTLGINNKVPPLDNPKVVQAIEYALDRDQINQVIYNGSCPPISQVFVPGVQGHVDGLDYKFDLKKAQQLMDESGVGKVTVKLQGVAGAPTAATDLYASMLAKIGITVQVTQSPAQAVFPNFFSGQFGLSVLQLFTSAPDPSYTTDFLVGAFNPGTKDPQLVSLVEKANALSVDDPARTKAYEAVNRYEFDHPVMIPICQTPNLLVARPKVVGWEKLPFHTVGDLDFNRLYLSK